MNTPPTCVRKVCRRCKKTFPADTAHRWHCDACRAAITRQRP